MENTTINTNYLFALKYAHRKAVKYHSMNKILISIIEKYLHSLDITDYMRYKEAIK